MEDIRDEDCGNKEKLNCFYGTLVDCAKRFDKLVNTFNYLSNERNHISEKGNIIKEDI